MLRALLILTSIAVSLTFSSTTFADLIWVGTTGGGDGMSVFQEANWQSTDATPVVVDGSTPLNSAYGTVIMDGTGLSGTSYGPYSPDFDLGGNQLLLSAGNLIASGGAGLRSNIGGGNSAVDLSGNSSGAFQFMLDIDMTLRDQSTLRFFGGGNPVNMSTIDLESVWTGSINWDDESVADATSQHLSKITVGGAAAVIGVNVQITSDGGTGSTLTLISSVPEPSSLAFLGTLALGGLLVRRRNN